MPEPYHISSDTTKCLSCYPYKVAADDRPVSISAYNSVSTDVERESRSWSDPINEHENLEAIPYDTIKSCPEWLNGYRLLQKQAPSTIGAKHDCFLPLSNKRNTAWATK